jgi:hypothetical protein
VISIKRAFALAIAAASALPVVNAIDVFDQVLSPFRGVNLALLYQNYASIWDFALFLPLFLGAGRAILPKYFPGAGGKAITIAVGIILALTLSVAEETIGFRLVTVFGPIAAALFIALVGITTYQMLVAFGAAALISGSFTYIIVYLSFTDIAPEYFDWFNAKVPILDGILALGLFISFILLIYGVVRQIRIRISAPRPIRADKPDPRTERKVQSLKQERKTE